MSTLDRLKQQKEFYTTKNVTAVPVSVLLDLWRDLPKLLAVVEAAATMREDFEGVDWLSPGAQEYDKARAELEETK